MLLQIHKQRLHTKDYLTDNDIEQALNDVQYYREYHQEKPGFFDATINTGLLILRMLLSLTHN